MSTPITIEAAQAKLEQAKASVDEAKTILEQMKAQSKPSTLGLAAMTIALQPGEHYAGTVLDTDGTIKHHLVLMARSNSGNWKDAMEWAERIGGALPDRQEQVLLFANCRPHLQRDWHWSCETHSSGAPFAWCCNFGDGRQTSYRESTEGVAVAVRRVMVEQ